MKRFLLPVLGWTMAISQLFAQKQLAPSVQAYGDDLPAAVRVTLLEAGFDLNPNEANQQEESIDFRSSDLQLDSTVTFINYVAGDSTPFARTWHTYPESNVEVVRDFAFDVDHWNVLYRTTILSDDLGRETDIITLIYDAENDTYVNESRLQVYPHGNSAELVDSFFVSVWNVEEGIWQRQLSTWNTFSEDRLLESLTSFEFFQVPILFLDRYSYDENSFLKSIDSYTLDSGEEIPAGRQVFLYTDGLLDNSTTYIADGLGGFLPETRMEYTYTPNGLQELINTFTYDFEKNDWKLSQVDGYAYDNEDRLVLAELVQFDEIGFMTRTKTDFAYEQDELLAHEIHSTYDTNIENWIVVDKKFYYYTNLTAVDPLEPVAGDLFLYPNPTTGMVQMKLTGNMKVYVYSMSGEMIRTYQLPVGERILDLSYLPAGMYQVRATVDGDYFSSKLIVQ